MSWVNISIVCCNVPHTVQLFVCVRERVSTIDVLDGRGCYSTRLPLLPFKVSVVCVCALLTTTDLLTVYARSLGWNGTLQVTNYQLRIYVRV